MSPNCHFSLLSYFQRLEQKQYWFREKPVNAKVCGQKKGMVRNYGDFKN